MKARQRKLIGMIGLLAFVAAYAVAAVLIAERLPDNFADQSIFYVIAGLAWGVPILPLITWMNRGR